MYKRYKFILSILFFVILSIIGNAESETFKLPPKKKKAEMPNRIVFPAPFNRWNSCDLSSMMYSGYNCKDGAISGTNLGNITKVAIWEEKDKKHLLALFETFESGAEDLPLSDSSKNVGIAVYDLKNGELNLTASAKDVITYRWFGSSYFDLAPYQINKEERAIGIRNDPGINGTSGIEYLHLFRLLNDKLEPIFSREIIDAEYTRDKAGEIDFPNILRKDSILQIIARKTGMNALKIVTRYFRFNDDGDVDKSRIIKKTSEIWEWDDKSRSYQLK
jgi:hypothetical protein